MGEVRTTVKIINGLDEHLFRQGQLQTRQVRQYEADALVDTGAVHSVIPVYVLQKLGLALRGQRVTKVK